MFENLKENFINMITSRVFVLMIVLVAITAVMINRIFDLQIVHGEEYLDSFQMRIMREQTIKGSRGCIYDRNGKLLAYNELAHSVIIEDVYESGRFKNLNLNNTIYQLIDIIEGNGDSIVSDFKIVLDKNGRYMFTVEGTQLYRFLADVYGRLTIEDLEEKERTATAQEVVDYLCGWERFRIGNYTEDDDKNTFVPGNGYTKDEVLKILTIRYDMNNNSYQKFIPTTVATDVSEETVAVVMENSIELEGVSIMEDTIRKYVDSLYFSHILGYTGKISQEELTALQEENGEDSYDLNDTVGKLGIEKSMEAELQGIKGSRVIFVNSMGKVIETADYVEPVAGNNVYLTIDHDLQIAAYRILEEKLASILYTNIINAKEFNTNDVSSSNIKIPIYDVYFALINNNVINTEHFNETDAGETEKAVYHSYVERKAGVFENLRMELTDTLTSYDQLPMEYQIYESYIAEMLYDNGIIVRERVDMEDETYVAWTKDEVISLNEYLNYCIAMNWIDVTRLNLGSQYSDSEKIYDGIVDYIFEQLDGDLDFTKRIYRFMIKNDVISGVQICQILLEQKLVEIPTEEQEQFERGAESAYTFIMNRIQNLDITPAQLALDPHSASMVITDVKTGDVLALVSYPGYDNNKMANGVNAEYYSQLLNDLSTPLINYATRQMTAPGSTFKMVSSTAGLMEETITPFTTFTCTGIFDKIKPPPTCWIYPRGSHGSLNVTGGIRNSCNMFFYELGYRLGLTGDNYSSETALKKLETYVDMYGLTETSGIEIEETAPQLATDDAVRAAIGQDNQSYSTVGLARYVTAVANSGTCYNLTLVDRITDRSGTLIDDNSAEVRNIIDMEPAYWDAIQLGMRQMIENNAYYKDMPIHVAGKTGTAEENQNRANHALFVCYAPYEEPEIAIATRIAYGYTSSYAARTTKEVLRYYFDLASEEEIITGTASQMSGSTAVTD
ncbi:penicillin-binding transpeptidase domain-containing protein [Parablautia muri]|uniref:Penicillin-binding protein n=1 Tax=Parablautia muri TaxID=2320879 RepID=A0A9X5BD04_9FIRM|nr:penicillin-binding transpeptidase domain-containing protein [Parablautia muri]NBJ91424.1 penicillin-binding protein [Parablautia muri]